MRSAGEGALGQAGEGNCDHNKWRSRRRENHVVKPAHPAAGTNERVNPANDTGEQEVVPMMKPNPNATDVLEDQSTPRGGFTLPNAKQAITVAYPAATSQRISRFFRAYRRG